MGERKLAADGGCVPAQLAWTRADAGDNLAIGGARGDEPSEMAFSMRNSCGPESSVHVRGATRCGLLLSSGVAPRDALANADSGA